MKPGGIVTFSQFVRWLRIGAPIAFIAVAALTVRLTVLSANHYNRAVEAERADDYAEAIRAYTWSIRNYYPGNPYAARSLENALSIVDVYGKNERFDRQKQALQDLHAVLWAIRSFYQPYRIELRRIESALQAAGKHPKKQNE